MPVDHLYLLDQIQLAQRAVVGDKAFYLGLLMQQGYPVPPGFVVSAEVFQEFLGHINWLEPAFADLPNSSLHLDVDHPRQLQLVAQQIRQAIQSTPLPDGLMTQLEAAARNWQTSALILRPSFSLRSGIDPTLSHRTTGLLEAKVCWIEPEAIAQTLRQVWAELFRAKSLFYWQRLGMQPQQVQLAVLVQPVCSAIASGEVRVYETYQEVRTVWGLGQAMVSGEVMPDYYQVTFDGEVQARQIGQKNYAYRVAIESEPPASSGSFDRIAVADRCLQVYAVESAQQTQPALTQDQLQQLIHLTQQAKAALKMPVELEWVLHDQPGSPPQIYITQVIPQLTTWVAAKEGVTQKGAQLNRGEELFSLPHSPVSPASHLFIPPSLHNGLFTGGLAAAPGRVTAPAWVADSTTPPATDIPTGVILVIPSLPPDWLLWLKQAAGIVTEQGGMTSHGAILAREMGIPAVVGVANATRFIQTGTMLLIDGDRGEVHQIEAESAEVKLEAAGADLIALAAERPVAYISGAVSGTTMSDQPISASALSPGQPNATRLFVTLSQPDSIAQVASSPIDGVGLIRAELMMLEALEHRHPDLWIQQGQQTELVNRIATQIQQFAQAFAPRPVFYRSSDMRSHEFLTLERQPTAAETNPMLGLRGTFGYQTNPALFELELAALRQVQDLGASNVHLILPFVRTVEEFTFCRQRIQEAGLFQNVHFQLWIMAEVPSVLLLLPDYIQAGVQGISIGSNDLTQLLLGVDRDQRQMAIAFDQRHPAVMRAMQQLIQTAQQAGIPCSICGQAPGQYPEMIDSLIRWGITAISVDPGEIEQTHAVIARAERRLLLEAARRQNLLG